MDAAPRAIKPMPRGILTPENSRIAPRTRSASPRSSSRALILSSIWDMNPPLNVGVTFARLPAAPPPAAEELLFSTFSWSKDASCRLAFFAALPAALYALAWLFRASALSRLCAAVVPKIFATMSARTAET